MNHTSDLAVIVVNYGAATLLERNLAPLTRSLPDLTVVVVDNFSSAAERDAITGLGAREGWILEAPAGNAGFGAGMNLGVARAQQEGCRNFLMLNPDAVIDVASLHALLDHVRAEPLTLFAPLMFRGDGARWFDGSDLYLTDGRIRSSRRRDDAPAGPVEPWLTGACLMISDELWRRVGGFDPEFFLYWEDVDLSWRIGQCGGSLRIVGDASVTHDEGGTQRVGAPTRAKSDLYYYYNIRNRMIFARRHLTPRQVRRWARPSVAIAIEVLLQGGRRQFLRPRRPVVAAVCGVLDGFRGRMGPWRRQELQRADPAQRVPQTTG